MSTTVLVINSGSSSIKYQLIEPEEGVVVASGLVERIGEAAGLLRHTFEGVDTRLTEPVADHGAGLRRVLELFAEVGPDLGAAGIVAVGHRVVQGGARYSGPALVDEKVLADIEELIPLAPLHNPPNLRGIQVARELLPDVPHVAVFDTAFFSDLPDAAATYALDREVAKRYRVRRYGAHGTSHQYVSRTAATVVGRPLEELRQVVLHLGNGASASAVVGGRAVDTSMGMTPLEGLVMGTRTGDIDPAVIFHLSRNAGFTIDEIDDLFNRRSGLKGLSGQNDMREVHALVADGDAGARLALDVYAHRLRKYVGAYAAVMGGLDVLSFTAGIGENDDIVRAEALRGLEFLGIELDAARNTGRLSEPKVVSTDGSRVTVLVVPTKEEQEIARQTVSLL
ncbi:acetate kinase [Georgenia satyanarayanai]|uniref:Acetate kinase n=1 Tax=Georgenia satyanarayanai TaxID=860221 RepID=A0A2Y9ACK9_9MICO|nr:acetate kinase [Georgenia satyanarayanai]PYG00648.1 acetate kinase [Georgenia satyanarayanai]SSA40037.1 acetate kinase [Georgenia satyanarayanai]